MAIILDHLQGLSDSKWMGIPGSVAVCVGLDIHSIPGLTQVHQKLTKNSGSTVDEFVKVRLACSNGYSFWFSSTSGKIWARSSAGSWSLAHTTTSTGDDFCLGAEEYNGYIYWATSTRLHRIAIADADNSWASVSHDWATFTVGNTSWHPMAKQNLKLFIGDGNLVASVNSSGTFTANALDIKTPFQIKTMVPFDIDLLIGTWVADTVNRTEVIRWDTTSPSWNTSDPIEEVGINAFMRDDNYMYAQAGLAGNWYYYDGVQLQPFKRIPGTYTSTSYGVVHPGATANFKGIPVFGFSNGSGNPALQGVYSMGSYSKDYPKVLDLSWPISSGSLSSIEIGAILVLGFDLLVAWKDGSTYGVDAIDYSAKYASAYLETRMIYPGQRDIEKVMSAAYAFYNSLPASTAVVISYSKNAAAYVSMSAETKVNSIFQKVQSELSVDGIGSLQLKFAFTVSSNDAHTIEAYGVDFE